MSTPHPDPNAVDGPSAAEIAEELAALNEKIEGFLKSLDVTADDVEVWFQRRSLRGWTMDLNGLRPIQASTPGDLVVRVFKDQEVGHAQTQGLDEGRWREAVAAAAATLEPNPESPPPRPQARQPSPITFDSDLANRLAPRRELHRVAWALLDNTAHEATRVHGLETLEGQLTYQAQRTIIARSGGSVATLQAFLQGYITLNHLYGDLFHQTHSPDSLQPLALMGARTWRGMPQAVFTPQGQTVSEVLALLHPRVFEKLLRGAAPTKLSEDTPDGPEEGDRFASPNITIIDDPGLDGLSTSRAFDDEGCPTRRTPLVIRGRVIQRFQGRVRGRPQVGGRWRRGARLPGPGRFGFASLLMERGELGFHEIVASLEQGILVQDIEGLEINEETSAFSARVRWGLTLQRNMPSALLSTGAWRIEGLLFPGEQGEGLLEDVVLSRELYDTGTGILPYCLGHVRLIGG